MEKPRILCASYGGGHIKAVLPVLSELMKRGWQVDLLALTTAYNIAKDQGFTPWRVADFLDSGDEAILAKARELTSGFAQSALVSREETEAYFAFGYASLVSEFGQARAASLFAEKGRGVFAPVNLAERVLERSDPDLVLTTNSPRTEKALIDVAQLRGVPAIVLNDLLASESNFWLHNPSYADRILVFNDFVKRRLIASGHDPKKLVVTGNPAFQPMLDLAEQILDRQRRDRPVVLYASQPLPVEDHDHHKDMIATLNAIAWSRRDWDVRVRLHPNEDQNPSWLAYPLNCKREVSLAEDLLDADVLVTHGSTAGLEAAIAGVRVVQQLGSQVAAAVRYDQMGIAIPSKDMASLESVIERALADSSTTNVAMLDQPAKRAADAIEEYALND